MKKKQTETKYQRSHTRKRHKHKARTLSDDKKKRCDEGR